MEELKAAFKNKENAARIVLQDAWQNGHRCVELRRDGRAVIFVCTICSVRCYSDATLVEHLRGNRHARKVANSLAPVSPKVAEVCFEESALLEPAPISKSGPQTDDAAVFPTSSLEWIGSGRVCLSEDHSDLSQQVKGIWCQWLGRNLSSDMHASNGIKQTEDLTYGIVVFPYSDAIGRRGDWKPGSVIKETEILSQKDLSETDVKRANQSSILKEDLFHDDNNVKENACVELHFSQGLSEKGLRKALKKKRLNLIERFCFICQQRMLPGKVVAAVLNLKTNQMACNSRNERGAFHVFHLSCLVDWILFCESKFWVASATRKDGRRMRGQVSKKPRKRKAKDMVVNTGCFFCPECQGTGVEVHCHQLEKPRYRLAQVFEWILELIQARRLWMCHPEKHSDSRGLIFSFDAHCQSVVTILGSLHFYAAGSLDFLGECCCVSDS